MTKRKQNDLSDGKNQIIVGLLNEYDIRTAEDIQEALKDLLGGNIKNIMEAEMDEHLGYEKGQRSVFPSDTALFKALYLATQIATKKWGQSLL